MLFYRTVHFKTEGGRIHTANMDGYGKTQIATLNPLHIPDVGLAVNNRNTICWANAGRCRTNRHMFYVKQTCNLHLNVLY